MVRDAGPWDRDGAVLRPTSQLQRSGTVTLAVDPRTAARAKPTNADLAHATLKAETQERALLSDGAFGSWFPVHGPKQDSSVTPGQVSCSEMESVLSYEEATKQPAPSQARLV